MNPRRRILRAAVALGACGVAPSAVQTQATSHEPFGPVRPPQPATATRLLTHEGVATDLRSLLVGRVTALQLMFTTCSVTCPVQGALFAHAQGLVPGDNATPMRWLSVSIDPRSDDPAALRRWLQRFGAGPHWIAAAPPIDEVEPLLKALRGRSRGPDRHVGQVFFFDRQAQLVYRSADLPSAEQVVSLAQQVAALR
jgi:protein SCO1